MSCYVQRYSDELYHYGVLGMKWGVRRFQKKDGTRTALGKKHEAELESGEKKKGVIQRTKEKIKANDEKNHAEMKKKFMEAGLSEEDADREARARIKTEKILLGVAAGTAIAVGAAVGYKAYQVHKNSMDEMIESGAVLQRIEMKDGATLNNYFFASHNEKDNDKYYGLLGKTRQMQAGKAYKMEIGVNKEQKIAGVKNSKKIYENLVNGDPAFGKWAKSNYKNYTEFNRGFLADKSEKGQKMQQRYFDAVRKAGYTGFKDINDLKYSGYDAKSPVIFINNGQDYTVKSMRKLGDHEVDDKFMKYQGQALGKMLSLDILKYAGAYAGATYAGKKIQDKYGDYSEEVDEINRKKSEEEARKNSKRR